MRYVPGMICATVLLIFGAHFASTWLLVVGTVALLFSLPA